MLASSLLRGLATFALAFSHVSALTSTLKQITNFGTNHTSVGFYIYVPTTVKPNPAVIVAAHYCTGTAQAYFSGTQYAALADTYGYIVIYPNSPNSGSCWDVASNATLTHNAGGDSLGIVSMVKYAIGTYKADSTRIFVTGSSSGAMMTNVLAGAYPDVFAAGSVYSGVPYGCFEGPNMWNSQCAEGQLIKTGAKWAQLVHAGYPGYTGIRPRMQIWHGTVDTTLYYQNLVESNKQWSTVFGITFDHNITNSPQSGYTQMVWSDNNTKYVAYSAQGVGHTGMYLDRKRLAPEGRTNSGRTV